jgi:UDP-N-acetyl-2-amino-2-deoxyglucuronate dehydrogenase
MKKLNFALIGCGRIGTRHAEHISNLANLVAVCDIDNIKRKKFSESYNCNEYKTIEDLLHCEKNLDVVSICTPNGLHYEHSMKALNSGINVLCEKPLALTSFDCGNMIKAAENNNKRLFVIKQNRYNPPVVAVKNAIDNGMFGKIYSIQLNCFWNRNEDYYKDSWKGTLKLDGGTLYTQFSHFIDLLYWLIGDVKDVKSIIKNFHHKNIIQFEDTGVVILEFMNESIGTINYTVNSFSKNMEGSLAIFGEKGTVKIGGQYLNELEYQDFADFEIKDLPPGNKPNNYGNYVGSMSNHKDVYLNVIDVLQNNGTVMTNSYEGLKVVEIIEKIYNSAK